MSPRLAGVLAVDLGTSGARAAVVTFEGAARGRGEHAYRPLSPPELAPLGREYDPRALEAAFEASVARAIDAASDVEIRAVAVTGQRIACAFVDGDGDVVYVGPNADVRALTGGELGDLDGDDLYHRKGRFPPWISAPARLRWFRDRAEARFAEIARVTSLPGYLLARALGAERHATDPTLAADLWMLDLDPLVRAPLESGLSDEAWPELVAATDPVGTLRADVARVHGIGEVPLAAGIADTQAALLASGARDALIAGGSAPLVRKLDAPLRDPARRLWLSPAEGGFMLEANLGEMGTMHAWLRDLLGVASFDELDALAESAAPGCRGASAHVGPRPMDLRRLNTGRPAAVLMPFGQVSGEDAPCRAELARAYLESCAFAVRAARPWLDAVAPSSRLALIGGMSRSRALASILATALGEPIAVGAEDATLRGAAMVAAVTAGAFGSVREARAAMSGPPPVQIEPTEAHAEDTDEAFERWVEREAQLEEHG
ncbi:MAG: FGGY family carbohydrate kinase [Sandaracinaceae bacterium]